MAKKPPSRESYHEEERQTPKDHLRLQGEQANDILQGLILFLLQADGTYRWEKRQTVRFILKWITDGGKSVKYV